MFHDIVIDIVQTEKTNPQLSSTIISNSMNRIRNIGT